MSEVKPRRLLTAKYDDKVFFERMLFDEFGAEIMPHFPGNTQNARTTLLLALAILRHVNGTSHVAHVGLSTLSQNLGYTTNDHKFRKKLDVLLDIGFYTQQGKEGRAPVLRPSLPEHLREKYEEDFNDAIGYEVIAVTDTGPQRPRAKKAVDQSEAPSQASPSPRPVDPFQGIADTPHFPVTPLEAPGPLVRRPTPTPATSATRRRRFGGDQH